MSIAQDDVLRLANVAMEAEIDASAARRRVDDAERALRKARASYEEARWRAADAREKHRDVWTRWKSQPVEPTT
jgi:hypothetical protein